MKEFLMVRRRCKEFAPFGADRFDLESFYQGVKNYTYGHFKMNGVGPNGGAGIAKYCWIYGQMDEHGYIFNVVVCDQNNEKWAYTIDDGVVTYFLEGESKQLDSGEVDMETAESVQD